VTKFLPEFKKVKVYVGDGKLEDPVREITIHQLLTHTAGLAYGGMPSPVDEMYDNADLWNIDITLEECIHKIAALPLMYQPGERWYYSAATDVVARLVEMIGDTNMAEFLREKILNPLGMVDTDYTVPPEKVDRIANLYGLTEKGPLELIETGADSEHTKDVRLFAGGHGLASTAADYLRFAQMFLNRGELDGVRILGRKTVDLMILNHLLPSMLPIAAPDPQPGMGFGLGFYVVMDLAQLRMMGSIGDHGWGGAADTHFWIDPQEQIVAIILQQYMPTRVNMTLVDYRTLVYQALEG
jgi:CubicO group peptidase (beta-lactamase class C family)